MSNANSELVVVIGLFAALSLCGISHAKPDTNKWRFSRLGDHCEITTEVAPGRDGFYTFLASVSLVIYYDDSLPEPRHCNSGAPRKTITAMLLPALGGDIQSDTHAMVASSSLMNEFAPVHHQGSDCSIETVYMWDYRATGLLLEALEDSEDIFLTAHLRGFGRFEGYVPLDDFAEARAQFEACIGELQDSL